MKYTVEQVLDFLYEDELNHPSGKPADYIADFHCTLAEMVADGKIELVIMDGRPLFKAISMIPIKIDLTITKEMLN